MSEMRTNLLLSHPQFCVQWTTVTFGRKYFYVSSMGSILENIIWVVISQLVGGGDNWAEKHRNRHRSILILQLLPQTAKAQSMTPQTIKYRYRTVTFKQRNH